MTSNTQVRISTDTRDALKDVGKMGDTYDSLIIEMIRVYRTYIEFVANHKTETDDTDDGA